MPGLIAVLSAVVGTATAVAVAQDDGGTRLSNVKVGIRGQYQVGRWTALEADVDSDSWPVRLSVRVPDPDGHLTRQPSIEVPEPASSPVRVRLLFQAGRLTDNDDEEKAIAQTGLLRVDVETPEEVFPFHLQASEPVNPREIHVPMLSDAWTQKTRFWAILGEPDGFERAAQRIIDRSSGVRLPVHVLPLSDATELPTLPDALESLSLVVVVGPQPVGPEADAAIREWVLNGGHLVLSLADPEEYAALPFSQWLPIRVTGQSRLRDLSALTSQVPGSAAVSVGIVPALQFDFDHGETVVATLDGPLWARVPFGFGRVSVLGVDVSRRPLVAWESLPLLCEKLTDDRRGLDQVQQRTTASQLSQTGISELQTQLVTGLDQFAASRKPTSWMAMGWILLYLMAIGPLDYLIVHKLLRRPHWTWVTFPAMVLIVALAAAVAARQRHPEAVLANQVDLVDVDAASGRTRVRSWTAFMSPQSRRYAIHAELQELTSGLEAAGDLRQRLSWTAIPETGFRGMYRTGGLNQWKPAYSFAPERDGIVDLPVALWSSSNNTAVWTGTSTIANEVVVADLQAEAAGQLVGRLTNRLDVPLEDWFLAHAGRVYVPQTRTAGAAALRIAPGESLDLADGRRIVPRVLQSYLTGVRRLRVSSRNTTGEDVIATRDTYDTLARDPYEVLKMVSFFEAADGGEFTTLTNHTLDRLDLSPLLPLDRAILFCRVELPAARFFAAEKSLSAAEQSTILRVVFPVRVR